MTFLENTDKAKLQKILLVAISVLLLAALTLLLVIIVMSIDTTGLKTQNMEFKDISLTEKDISSGSLLLADNDHPYKAADEAWLDLIGCTEYMESQPDATGIGVPESEYYEKNYIPWKKMKLNKTAMAATHKMLTAAKNSVKENPVTIDAAYGLIAFGDVNNYENNTACLILLSDYTSTSTTRAPLSEAYRTWFNKNASSYGFVKTANEDEYRYVGAVHAKHMTDKKLTLADYIEYLKENTSPETGLPVELNGDKYHVYYVAAKAGDSVKAPADLDYEISGTNEGGVIITVKLDK